MTEITADAAESDDALMRRFCSGDEAAFGLLYDRFAPDLGIFLRRFVQANAARDALRRRSARREDVVPPDALGNVEGERPAASDPQMAEAIKTALQQLPPDQREAVLLHKLHGLSFPEVASALGTTVAAAKVRAHRGYQRLRVLLAPWENK